MTIYAVRYTYDHQLANLLQDFRPSHRMFLRDLHTRGILITSGFLRDAQTEGALIILRADSAHEALALLEDDPFQLNGLIVERSAMEWTPTIGALADGFDTEFPSS